MSVETRKLYDEAGQLHKQALDVLAQFEGTQMPDDKAKEVDKLLDQVETLTQQAKRVERVDTAKRDIETGVNREDVFNEDLPVKVSIGGRELTADEVKELSAVTRFPAFVSGRESAYKAAMRKYHRKGAGGLTADELKTLTVGTAPAGGYLVQDTYLNEMIMVEREASAMRRISRVLPPMPPGSVITPSEESLFSDFEWTTEIGEANEDTVKPFGARKLTPHPFSKLVRVSNVLLRNPLFDAEAWSRERLAYKAAVTQENGFVNGDGVVKPLGLLKTASLPTYTTAASNTMTGDDIINWAYRLPASYAPNARILCNRAFIRKVRLLKTSDDYLWQPGLQQGSPSMILDFPYELSDRFDDGLDGSDVYEDNAIVAVIGDFMYYWIVDSLQFSVQVLFELYAKTNETGYIGRGESDGMAVLPTAFYGLKIKA